MGTVMCTSKASRCAMRDVIHLLECLFNLQEVLSSIPRTCYKTRHVVGQGSSWRQKDQKFKIIFLGNHDLEANLGNIITK